MLSDSIFLFSLTMSPTPHNNSIKNLSLVASSTEDWFLLRENVSCVCCCYLSSPLAQPFFFSITTACFRFLKSLLKGYVFDPVFYLSRLLKCLIS
ncbi:hypothetical protein HanPSC8_Chr08g0307541 [Helianthus annuus]|nr:hypothetical protein HanPSC8_Chr08g0307541 [Helianthus annuus]